MLMTQATYDTGMLTTKYVASDMRSERNVPGFGTAITKQHGQP
jgi:hypothetical protein